MIRVLLADDHTMVRKGLQLLLAAQGDMEVVGEADEGEAAARLVQQLDVDVVLMDLSMPEGLGGFGAIKKIRTLAPDVRLLALTMHDEEIFIQQAIRSGAHGYVLKNSHSEVLIHGIRAVARGETFYRTSVSADRVHEWLQAKDQSYSSVLTDREKEIVRLTVLGFSNKEIAEQLSISGKTVENHKTNIMHKLHLSTKHELIQYAIKNRYLDAALGLDVQLPEG